MNKTISTNKKEKQREYYIKNKDKILLRNKIKKYYDKEFDITLKKDFQEKFMDDYLQKFLTRTI